MNLEFLRDRKGGKEDVFFEVQDLYFVDDPVSVVDRLGNVIRIKPTFLPSS